MQLFIGFRGAHTRARNGTAGTTHALGGFARSASDLNDGRGLRDGIRGKPVRSGPQPLDRVRRLHGDIPNARLTPHIIARLDAAVHRCRSLRA
jgi:hypothetical protein